MDVENEAESVLVPEEGSGPEVRLDSCPVCRVNLSSRGAKLLPCLHSICHRCSPADAPADTVIRCPVCRCECVEADVMENFFVKDAAESPSSTVDGNAQMCKSCDDHTEASSFCGDCSEYLCGACVEAHRRVRFTREHQIRPKTEAPDAPAVSSHRPVFCRRHRQEALKIFCQTCDTLTCRDCQLLEHKEHRYQFLDDAFQSHKLQLEKMTEQLQEKQKLVDEVSNSINEGLRRVSQNRASVRRQITASVCSLVEEINRKEKMLMQQLEVATREHESVLLKQQQEVTDLSGHVRHILQFSSWALSRNGTVALLTCKRLIQTQIENLLRTTGSTTFVPPGAVRFQCRSSYWAAGVDLGSIVQEPSPGHRSRCDPGIPVQKSVAPPSDTPLTLTSRTPHSTLAQLQMQVDKIDQSWQPRQSPPWCQRVRMQRTEPAQSRSFCPPDPRAPQPPRNHLTSRAWSTPQMELLERKPSFTQSHQLPTPERTNQGIQVSSGFEEDFKEEKPRTMEMQQTIVALSSSVRKRRRSSSEPDLAIKKEPHDDLT